MLNFKVSANGYPVFHFQMKDSPICAAKIVANCGSSHEDEDSWGVAHFLEHMCFQGTPTKNKHQVSREQSLVGAYNAYTHQHNTVYYFDALNEDFERGFNLLKEAVFDSNYPEKEFDKEKSVIVEEWRMYDNEPTQHFFNYFNKNFYGSQEGHPIIGTKESILDMNPEKLHRFRNKWYGKNNLFVVVVGNLEFNKVMEAVETMLPAAKTVEKDTINSKTYPGRYSFENDRFDQAVFGLAGKWVGIRESVKNNLIDAFFKSALSKYMYEYIRDDLGLCYGVGISVDTDRSGKSNFLVNMLTSNQHLEKAEKELNNLFNKVKSEGFPQEIFEISKKRMTYSRLKLLESSVGVAEFINGTASMVDDCSWFFEEGYKMMDQKYIKEASEKLTQNDLKKFANEYLNNFSYFTMISSKKE